MSDGIVFIDGEYMHPEDARMSIFDAGFVWGDCVYDVTSTWNDWFFMLDEHLERFERSCEGFRLENPYSFEEMRRICAECVDRAGLANAYVKMQITRGIPPHGIRDPRGLIPSVVVYAVPYVWIWGEDKCRNGANLFVSSVERVSSRAIDQRFKNYNRADRKSQRLPNGPIRTSIPEPVTKAERRRSDRIRYRPKQPSNHAPVPGRRAFDQTGRGEVRGAAPRAPRHAP